MKKPKLTKYDFILFVLLAKSDVFLLHRRHIDLSLDRFVAVKFLF